MIRYGFRPILKSMGSRIWDGRSLGDAQMAAKEKKQHTNDKAVPQMTAAERTAIEKYLAKSTARPRVRFKVSKNGSDEQLELDQDALGSADRDFVNGIVNQLANTNKCDQDLSAHVNFVLSVIKGIEPRDQLEAMLAAQMAAVHVASMTLARRLAHVETIPQQDSAERAFNKLIRTFAMQMEALKRYRSGAEQKVTLQHVSIAEGGQAIVGNVTHAPRESARERPAHEETVPPPGLTEAKVVPMLRMGTSEEHEPLSVRRKSNK